jgi:hypothetical protein
MTHIDMKGLWNVAEAEICWSGTYAVLTLLNASSAAIEVAAGHPYIAALNATVAATTGFSFGLMTRRAKHKYDKMMAGPH